MKKILGLLLVISSISPMHLAQSHNNNHANMIRFQEKLSALRDSDIAATTKNVPVFVPHQLKSVELSHGKKGFSVHQDGEKHEIKKCFTDPMVRNITKKELNTFLQNGFLSIKKSNDGEFLLKAIKRTKGGGPIFGAFMYGLTKATCYAVLGAAAGTLVVTTGGAVILGATSAVSAVVGGAAVGAAVTTTSALTITGASGCIISGAAVVAPAGAAMASSAVGTAIVSATAGVVALAPAALPVAAIAAATTAGSAAIGATLATEAAMVTAVAVVEAGNLLTLMAAIEVFSLHIGFICGAATPTL